MSAIPGRILTEDVHFTAKVSDSQEAAVTDPQLR